ncbi:unnamed protein product [Sphenostylis stenocarpa]|uniref:BZIP domain-containing protein n=1 Tax=Sphenostylis stenocarpa TaxID=92480 RepID=A0AA86RQU3_9FABA|nr:unnamed protein product [Sphenostylis stenocarpa]
MGSGVIRKLSEGSTRAHSWNQNRTTSIHFPLGPTFYFLFLESNEHQHVHSSSSLHLAYSSAISFGFVAWGYQAIHPPPPKLCGSPSGPPITAPRIKLKDGRNLAYKEHGDVAEDLGVYIVSFDRPGYGESDSHPNPTVKSLALDIEEVADKLGLGSKFYVIGFSLVGQLVWRCLKYIPHRYEAFRLAGAVLIAPVVNYWWDGLPENLTSEVFHQQKLQDQWTLVFIDPLLAKRKDRKNHVSRGVDLSDTWVRPCLTMSCQEEKEMVVEEGEMNSQGEAESRFQQDANKNHNSPFSPSSIGRQTSIYSLTLDEFQHSLCETGKNFGSMNMDEFISSIWNAEENQAIITSSNVPISQPFIDRDTITTTIRKQPSLPRQPSLSLPAPLCRKTVDEVWSQIQKEQHNNNNNNNNVMNNTESAPRQPTFGEMTLEDFLVKAGVVREPPCAPPPLPHHSHHLQQQPQHYTNNNGAMPGMGSSFVGRNVIGAVSNVVAPGYHVAEASGGYAGNGKRDGGGGFHQQGVCFGGSGYGVGPTMGMGGPVSPANSSDGIGNDCGQFGLEMSGLRGRKRMGDGPVEKVVERRQRRMIKNRESAARSRARKQNLIRFLPWQAYTVELEAELNQLKEENAQLRQALAEIERKRKEQSSNQRSESEREAESFEKEHEFSLVKKLHMVTREVLEILNAPEIVDLYD